MTGTVIHFPIVARRPIAELHRQQVPAWVGHGQPEHGATIIILPVIRIERYFYDDDGELQA